MTDIQHVRLADIAADFFRSDSRYRSTIFQVYSSLSDLDLLGARFFSSVKRDVAIDPSHPTAFLIGRFADFDVWFGHEFKYVGGDKKLIFFSKIDKIKLPETPLIIFCSPAVHDGSATNGARAENVMNAYKSIFASLFGRGFLFDRIATFSIDGDAEHKTSFSSKVWRVPQNLDCRALVDVAVYNDLVVRIPLQLEPLRSQITTACNFFSRALEEPQEYKRFFDYWTSLEILVQGKSQKIKAVLSRAYDAPLNFVDTNLRFKEISDLRHGLMHFGIFTRFEPDIERRIQGIFLDLIRHRVGLPCERITERLDA